MIWQQLSQNLIIYPQYHLTEPLECHGGGAGSSLLAAVSASAATDGHQSSLSGDGFQSQSPAPGPDGHPTAADSQTVNTKAPKPNNTHCAHSLDLTDVHRRRPLWPLTLNTSVWSKVTAFSPVCVCVCSAPTCTDWPFFCRDYFSEKFITYM